MTLNDHFQQLQTCLSGIFQNREQALADPAWFVHLRLWCCPTPPLSAEEATFFIEQASAAFSQPPYRQRILQLRQGSEGITAEYFALKEPEKWRGASVQPERLNELSMDDLQRLQGSCLRVDANVERNATRFEARQFPGERCQFVVNGEKKFVELGFDAIAPLPHSATPTAFWMYDKGIDATTGKFTWGAINGPFKLIKVATFD